MNKLNKIDEVMLASFVDDQLDTANREAIIKAMDEDKDLRDQIYNLRKTKDLMKLSFGAENLPETSPKTYTTTLHSQCVARIAAAFTALAIGLGAGFTGYQYCSQTGHTSHMSAQNLAALTQQQGERIILHISESDPVQFERTLTYTENFLNKHKNNNKVRIEVVANAGGIDLLRQDYPMSNKVKSMMDEYDNITFIACTNAINRLRAQGFEPTMIQDIDTEKAVLTHIIERLRTGWTYVKADSETLKI
ncbi:MAG: hypothetical protein DRQ44_03445 [Gammaproteobacteria bacterium]|nr:MAG: hypothetical protein DRQ44_03445 [Gammaproteobacteria bacterium]